MPNYKAGKKWYKSSYRGVRGCYKRFTVNVCGEYLGTFDDEKEAALAYDAKARELGKTKFLNFRADGVTRRVDVGRSVYRGVRPQNKKFDAKIGVGYKSEWLGTFEDEKDAALAYDRRARELGRHGSCNFDADGKFRDVGNPAAGRKGPAPPGPEAEGAERFERHESPGPAAAAPPGPEAVGWRVSVFWPAEDAWFPGTVRGFDGRRHRVRYDDGDVFDEDLRAARFERLAPPPACPICLEELGDGATALECGHGMHPGCVRAYVASSWSPPAAGARASPRLTFRCPTCRVATRAATD